MPLTDPEQARTTLRQRFAREFSACDRITARLERETRVWARETRTDTADRIIIAIVLRSLKTWLATVHLCEGGFGEQAAMLDRVLFEDMADVAWVSTHPDEAARNYDAHGRFDQLNTLDLARGFPQLGPVRPLQAAEHAELKRLKANLGKFGQKSWTQRSLHRRLTDSRAAFSDSEWEQLRPWHAIAHHRHNQ